MEEPSEDEDWFCSGCSSREEQVSTNWPHERKFDFLNRQCERVTNSQRVQKQHGQLFKVKPSWKMNCR